MSNVDLTKITSAFGLLDEATQEAMRAHGGPYERFSDGGWVDIEPRWTQMTVYRVKSKTKPSVDWSVLKKAWRFIARDLGGDAYCYADKPTQGNSGWLRGVSMRIDHLASYDPGTCDWRDSLVERPEGV